MQRMPLLKKVKIKKETDRKRNTRTGCLPLINGFNCFCVSCPLPPGYLVVNGFGDDR